jgi:arylamine N-acetyltransferase
VTDAWAEAYLNLLGVKGREPAWETLVELSQAHERVVFTNAASLIRRAATPHGDVPAMDLDAMLADWQAQGPGGVCYETASMASRLLQGMGFDSQDVLSDIVIPGEHQANMVTLAGRRFLLDFGNGGPFFAPIPMDEGPVEIDHGRLGYRFAREAGGRLVQYQRSAGGWQPFATYVEAVPSADDLAETYQLHHRLPARSFVMGNFTLVQMRDGETLALRDHTFSHYKHSGKTLRRIEDIDAYRGLIRDEFGLPGFPVEEALAAWSKVTGATV